MPYLAYDLLDYAAAEDALNDGLRAALDLGDPTLISYLHFWLGRAAADQQRTTTVLDHAFAAQSWAARSSSNLVRSLNESLFSMAHASDGESSACARAHDRAVAMADTPKSSEPSFLYWMSPSMAESRAAPSLIQLKQSRPAIAAVQRSLAGLGQQFKLDRGFALVSYAEALTLAKEIPEAASRLTEAADIASRHSSARLTDQLTKARARLEPWAGNARVRQLDENLRAHGVWQ
ncbi:hypothetical protein ACIBQ1_08145 [Nonomuraea sp. NPDC050153]|uniref:hypothetical protein n=1 Tax=Nonomuraea sp. NPDC050153 TaxID=3364359 RepID=UPI0037B4BE50